MTTVTTQYQCADCPGGIVNVVTKCIKNTITIKVGDCNKCKRSYGIKSACNLKEVPANTAEYIEQAKSGDFIIN